jgi:RHS repeat-associated protein
MSPQTTASRRLTHRLDGLGQTQYRYAVLGNGQRTFTEDGPWASDEVTVTNRYGLRAGLRLAQPSGGGFGFAALWPLRRNYTWYDGLLLAQERDGGNRPTVTYTRGRDLSGSYAGAGGIGGLLARSHGYSAGNWSSHNFYHADGNGTVTALVNSGGALQASYKYDPYGRYLSGGGALASANGLRFSSKPWVGFAGSTTSGLYSYGYRFYDPYLQRWVNRDPIGEMGGMNLYGFIANEPFSSVDTLGLAEYGDFYEFWCPRPQKSCPPSRPPCNWNPPGIRIMPPGGLLLPASSATTPASAVAGLPSILCWWNYDPTLGPSPAYSLAQAWEILFEPTPTCEQFEWDLKYRYRKPPRGELWIIPPRPQSPSRPKRPASQACPQQTDTRSPACTFINTIPNVVIRPIM